MNALEALKIAKDTGKMARPVEWAKHKNFSGIRWLDAAYLVGDEWRTTGLYWEIEGTGVPCPLLAPEDLFGEWEVLETPPICRVERSS